MRTYGKWFLAIALVAAMTTALAWAQAGSGLRRGEGQRGQRLERDQGPERAERGGRAERQEDVEHPERLDPRERAERTERPERAERAERVERGERPREPEGPAMVVVRLKHQPAEAAFHTLRQLFGQEMFEEAREHLAASVNEPANAVVLVGPPEIVGRLEDLLIQLDRATGERREIEEQRAGRMRERQEMERREMGEREEMERRSVERRDMFQRRHGQDREPMFQRRAPDRSGPGRRGQNRQQPMQQRGLVPQNPMMPQGMNPRMQRREQPRQDPMAPEVQPRGQLPRGVQPRTDVPQFRFQRNLPEVPDVRDMLERNRKELRDQVERWFGPGALPRRLEPREDAEDREGRIFEGPGYRLEIRPRDLRGDESRRKELRGDEPRAKEPRAEVPPIEKAPLKERTVPEKSKPIDKPKAQPMDDLGVLQRLLDKHVQDKLRLTPEQRQQIERVAAGAQSEVRRLRERGESADKVRQAAISFIMGILEPEQQKALRKMLTQPVPKKGDD